MIGFWKRTLSGKLAAVLYRVWGESLLGKFTSVLGANAFNNCVSFLILLYAARAFGPEEFGILTLAISISFLLSLLLDFGLSMTLVRIYNTEALPDERAKYITVILGFKLFSLLALVPLAFILQSITAEVLPILSDYGSLTYLAFLSGGLLSVWETVRAVEQARGDFRSFSRYTYAYGILRALSTGALFLFYGASPTSVLGALYTMPLAALLLYSRFGGYRPFSLLFAARAHRSSAYGKLKTAFSYSVWVAVSALCFNALSSLPQFALARAESEKEVGLYGAGLMFVAVFLLMNQALRTVILPDVTALTTSSDRLEFRRRYLRLGPVFFGVAVSALGFMAFVQYYLLGGAYVASVPIFVVLGSAFIVMMYLAIFNMLVHSHGVPRLEALNNLARVAVLAMLLLLVPKTALSVSLTLAGVLIAGELVVYVILRIMDVKSPTGSHQ